MPSKDANREKRDAMTHEELIAWRKRHKYTREELAAETRVSLKTIENYEQNIRQIPAIFKKTLELLVKVRNLQA